MALNDTSQQVTYSLDNSALHQSLTVLFLFPLMFLAVSGNTLVILAVWRDPALRTPSYYLLTSLALSDLLMGVVAMPLEVFSRIIQNSVTCSFVKSGYFSVWPYVFSSVSMVHLIVVTADRYLAVTRPLKYATIVTPVRVFIIIVFVWCASISYGIISVVNAVTTDDDLMTQLCSGVRYTDPSTRSFYLGTGVSIMTLGAVMVVLNLRILWIAVQQTQRIKQHRMAVNPDNNPKPAWKKNTNQVKATRTILFLVAIFCLSWYPTCIWYLIRMEIDISHVGQILLIESTYFFSNLSSAINPFIYCMRDSLFRRAFCRIFPPLKTCLIASKIHHNPEGETFAIRETKGNATTT